MLLYYPDLGQIFQLQSLTMKNKTVDTILDTNLICSDILLETRCSVMTD